MITSGDLFLVLFLVFLEGILSIDNALVLALLARNLPPHQQKKALTYGLVGAVFFRLVALSLVTQLLKWNWVKFVGGGYLVLVALKHFVFVQKDSSGARVQKKDHFWKVVLTIELTDIAFALDSILAAVALTPKFWIVFTGGVLGIVMMRYAASIFLVVLKKFPALEDTAFLLVFVIGIKIILEGLRMPQFDFHSASHPAFWIFWSTMAMCIVYGLVKKKK